MDVEGKYFMIVSEDSGLVLDVKGGKTSPGTDVILYKKTGTDNQLWYEDYTGAIRSKHSNLCLDFNSDNRLIVNEFEFGNTDQQFHYNIQRRTFDKDDNPNKVFDVVSGDTDSGAKICAWDYHGGNNQKWRIETIPEMGYFYIKSAMNGKVLDIEGGSKQSGAKVILYSQHKQQSDNQLWFEDRYGNIRSKLNYLLVLDASGNCLRTSEYQPGNRRQYWCISGNKILNRYDHNEVLDVKDANEDDGAELCGWGYHGGANQHWIFEYV